MPLPQFNHQTTDPHDEDSKLCAWFALNHYKGGGYSKQQFKTDAVAYYKSSLGMNDQDGLKLALDGNDPNVVQQLCGGSSETDPNQAATHSKIIIPTKSGHFVAVLRDDRNDWWNYDSLQMSATKIGGAQALVSFLGLNEPINENGYIVD